MDKSIYLASFTLVEAPYLAGINVRDALLQNIMIMTIYCMFYFNSQYCSLESVHGETMLKMGWVVKK